jgi:hypothetical protein
LAFVDIVSEPPYLGVPRLSHQCPVEVVVTAVVTAVVDVVEVGAITVVVVVVVTIAAVVVVVVGVLVVVFELQDASTSDATMRKVSAIQITPFFI